MSENNLLRWLGFVSASSAVYAALIGGLFYLQSENVLYVDTAKGTVVGALFLFLGVLFNYSVLKRSGRCESLLKRVVMLVITPLGLLGAGCSAFSLTTITTETLPHKVITLWFLFLLSLLGLYVSYKLYEKKRNTFLFLGKSREKLKFK